jgi:hypothetical protein
MAGSNDYLIASLSIEQANSTAYRLRMEVFSCPSW